MINRDYSKRITLILLFAVAMGYFEAAVVVYLRELFYPFGFTFPLREMPHNLIVIEIFRELSTLVMLLTVAGIAGKRFWERFGYFVVMFGVWDIFYYVWLWATIRWPMSLLDWDILFLIPIPWIGPVIAPVLVSILMIITGLAITGLYARGYTFRPDLWTWLAAIVATGLILYTFMRDTGAALKQQTPEPYSYGLFVLGLLLYMGAFLWAYHRTPGA